MWCHWHQHCHQMMLLAFVFLSCDANASYDVDSTISGTIAVLRSRWSKWDATWLFSHVTLLALSLESCDADSTVNGTIAFLRSKQLKWVWFQCHVTNCIINGTTTFLSLRQLKWGPTWLLSSCEAIGVGISVMQCLWCHQWYHSIT